MEFENVGWGERTATVWRTEAEDSYSQGNAKEPSNSAAG